MRLDYIDKAKGIGIILVILGHTVCPPSIKFWLYSFHMPLFFFLSGYVFKIKTPNFLDFLKNKINTLIIPALILGCISIIYSIIESLILNHPYSINCVQRFFGVFIQMRGFYEFSFGPWFLICLFTTQIIMYFLKKYVKSDKLILIIGIFSSILGYAYCNIIGIVLPWALDCSLIAILFFIVGYLINKNEDKFEKLFGFKYLFVYFFIHLGLVYIQLMTERIRVDMFSNQYDNYFYFIMTSFSGIFLIISLVRNIALNKELNYIGRNSLVYYGLHNRILSTSLLIGEQIFSNYFTQSYYFGFLNVFLCLLILNPISRLFNKYQILSGPSQLKWVNYVKNYK